MFLPALATHFGYLGLDCPSTPKIQFSFVTEGAAENDFISMAQCGSSGCLPLMLLKLSSSGAERRGGEGCEIFI